MKAQVDSDLCIGCGICPDVCPEVFTLDGAVATVITDIVPNDAEANCREAAEQCPVNAIIIHE